MARSALASFVLSSSPREGTQLNGKRSVRPSRPGRKRRYSWESGTLDLRGIGGHLWTRRHRRSLLGPDAGARTGSRTVTLSRRSQFTRSSQLSSLPTPDLRGGGRVSAGKSVRRGSDWLIRETAGPGSIHLSTRIHNAEIAWCGASRQRPPLAHLGNERSTAPRRRIAASSRADQTSGLTNPAFLVAIFAVDFAAFDPIAYRHLGQPHRVYGLSPEGKSTHAQARDRPAAARGGRGAQMSAP